jgi:two-component system heavy metal sensor histidine kinase CusS
MFALAALYLYWSLVEDVHRDDNAFLGNKVQECRRLLREGSKDMPLLAHEVETEAAASQFITYYVRLVDDRGALLLETPRMAGLLPRNLFPPGIEADAAPRAGTVWKSDAGRAYLLMSAWAQGEGGTRRLIEVALDVTGDETLVSGYRLKLAAVVALGILFSWGAGILVARRGLRPLLEIANATERVTASQLHERIGAKTWPVELASVARSFDRMLDRLEDAFRRLSQFSADLAHELRTPINNLRGEAGVALSRERSEDEYRRVLESSLEEYARLSRLIENLLFLARADGQLTIGKERCDARKAANVVAEYYTALAEEKGVQLHCEGAGMVEADPILLRQAISNLVANGVNYTPAGGNVNVTVQELNGSGVKIAVSDTGCGIAAEQLGRVGERLYRVDSARSQDPNGAGLGVAIVKSIMTLHGGSIDLESKLGGGTCVTLLFPPAESDAKLTKM